MRPGDYVRCNFPFRESHGPGPSPHIVLCLGTGQSRGIRIAIVAYTTSRITFEGRQRPRQHLLVDQARAISLGQAKSFHVDVSRVARLPMTSDYFPDLQDGLVAILGQDPKFVEKVVKRQQELIKSGYQIDRIDLVPSATLKP